MTPLPSIAILLSAYNGSEWIEDQISTILKQQDVSIQLFISVDLSADNTYALCKEFEQKKPI